MHSRDIRSTFTGFFSARGHHIVPSSSLMPSDSTLLLTNAGINQFTPYYLGSAAPPYRRAVSVQRCLRTSDIDNVGRTTRHATFFEMLGNFSFGDYFKAETISWAWELLTGRFGIDPERLWITVYEGDDEAEPMWRQLGVPESRIQRLGMRDNFWSMGVPGPCGPNSDVNYDRGPAFGQAGGPAVNPERYLELWGLVFMAYLRGEGTGKDSYSVVGELPARNIDTGLGLDRLATVLQDVETVCETDLLAPTLRAVEERAGRPYPGRDGSAESVSFQVITEHIRATAFLIADGVVPARDGRGYVLRRLLRRSIHHARLLGIEDSVLPELADTVIDTLGPEWPQLERHRSLVRQVVSGEEEAFARTLRQGSKLLAGAIGTARSSGSDRLPAETAFTLHDTYGFPVDLTVDAARAAGLAVDEDAVGALLAGRQRQAKQAEQDRKGQVVARQETYRSISARHGQTDFVGYDETSAEARLLALIADGQTVRHAVEGERVEVVLDRSPFYAEAGGQVGDSGILCTSDGARLRVLDTGYGVEGLQVHTAEVKKGDVRTGDAVEAVVDAGRRAAIARSHSATHVLHAMIRRVLGDHAVQQGSRVEPGRLRFDFAHPAAVDSGVLTGVQMLVNDHLLDDPEVRIWHASRREADAAGATALFGEKYGDYVRVVDIGDFSRELCGGTHVVHGSGAGPVHILGESSVGSGLRRIEALTGADALRHYDLEHAVLAEIAGLLRVRPEEAPDRLRQRLDSLAAAQRRLDQLRQEELASTARRLSRSAEAVSGSRGWLVAEVVEGVRSEDLRTLAADVLQRLGAGVVILGAEADGKAALVAAVDQALADSGVRARDLLSAAATIIGGGAGGKGALAHAGGRHPERLAEALGAASATARTVLTDHA